MTKWTAVEPKRKERHFIVTKLIRATDETIVACELEAVINKNNYEMDWRELKNTKVRSAKMYVVVFVVASYFHYNAGKR